MEQPLRASTDGIAALCSGGSITGAHVCAHSRDTGVSPLYGGQTFVEARTALCAVHGSGFYLGVLLTTVWQYREVVSRHVGFQTERLAVGSVNGAIEENEGISDAIRRQPYVEAVACSSKMLLQHYSTNRLTDAQGNFLCPLHFMLIDKDFPKVTGLKLLEGAFRSMSAKPWWARRRYGL